jgi:serine/threonine-protein kinase
MMALREKFGKLVLLEKLDEDALGTTFRAARVASSGRDRLVTLVRYSEAVSGHEEASRGLMDQARAAARLQVPGVTKILGIGRVEQSYYCSFELLEGRSLRALVDRAGEERFPFAAENALTVASRAAVILESLHSRQDDDGRARIHGLVTPSHLTVSWDGEVKVTGLGLWPSLRGTDLLGEAERRYLAPEQAAGGPGDARSDVYSLALVLLEALTQHRPSGTDPLEVVASARVVTALGEEEPLPEPLGTLVRKALAADPDSRHGSMGEMRQAVDALLFSGDFAPTTFNLAYFVQTLFRKEMEWETEALEEERDADYGEFQPPPVPSEEPPPASGTEPARTAEPGQATLADGAGATPATGPGPQEVARQMPSSRGPDASGPSRSGRRNRSRVSAEGSGRMFARAASERPAPRGLTLVAGLVLAALLGGGGGYLYFVKLRPLTATTSAATLSPDAEAAMARVRELEAQLAALQNEKAAAEAAEAERRALEEVEATPTPVPIAEPGTAAAAVAAAEAAAAAEAERARRRAAAREGRRRAQEEQARREAEIRRLEEEMKAAEAVLVAEQARGGGAAVALPAVLPPPPTPAPTLPPVQRGDLVDINDPRLVAPALVSSPPLKYPAVPSGREKPEVVVVVRALVDENGRVADARMLQSAKSPLAYDAEALKHARASRYNPATKNGVPVKVWILVRVVFPRQLN